MQQVVWNIVTMIAPFAVIAFVLVVLAEYLRVQQRIKRLEEMVHELQQRVESDT